ncbi:MAG TPA: DUF4229 domain-containing protein [Mycobacteriales bacterium]|nr:DUF4229 domain-containing protein [Mycobacteriales bacterium]
MAPGSGNTNRSPSRAFATYNLLRLGLLAACLGIGWLAGVHSIWLIVGSLFVSGVLSWFLLRRQREAMGAAVEQTVERSRVRFAARAASEDSYVDALETQQTGAEPGSVSGDQPAS